MLGYYYLHTNGDLIWKSNHFNIGDFDSDFVKKWWKCDSQNREDAWIILLEATALDANISKIKELASKWRLNFIDSIEMIKRVEPSNLMRDGLEKFVKVVFNLTPNEYWSLVKSKW